MSYDFTDIPPEARADILEALSALYAAMERQGVEYPRSLGKTLGEHIDDITTAFYDKLFYDRLETLPNDVT